MFFQLIRLLPELAGELRLIDFFLLIPSIKHINFIVQSFSSLLEILLIDSLSLIELLLVDIRRFPLNVENDNSDCVVSLVSYCINAVKSRRCFDVKRWKLLKIY